MVQAKRHRQSVGRSAVSDQLTNGMLRLRRDSRGLCIHVRLAPEFEEFAKSAGDGSVVPLELLGKEWTTDPGDPPIEIYDLSTPGLKGTYFSMDRPGMKIELAPGVANLSFLRIKGASQRTVRFWIKEPRSKKALHALYNTIGMGIAEVAEEFMRDVTLELHFSLSKTGV